MSVFDLLAPKKNWTDLNVNSITTDTFSADTINTNFLNTFGHPSSGTYTPTFTNTFGLNSIVMNTNMFIRFQNVVIVYGSFTANMQSGINNIQFSINPPPNATFSNNNAISVFLTGNVKSEQKDFAALTCSDYLIENSTSLHLAATSVISEGVYLVTYSNVFFNYIITFLST